MVERLMCILGIRGVLRAEKIVTTNPDISQPGPDDKVNLLFKADRLYCTSCGFQTSPICPHGRGRCTWNS
jgi:hypothetical protein